MPWYNDEQWSMIEDSIDKKRTAASAHKQRTHCGKGGSVKFPSDFMTRKELKAMNGDVISYRMNDPLSWDEFKELPNDLKGTYIQTLRDKFNVPDCELAAMFDVSLTKLTLYLKDLKLEMVHDTEIWNKEAFLAWRSGASSELVKENVPKTEEKTDYTWRPMSFEEFKMLSDENKKDYIRWIRDSFGSPDTAIAKMLGCSQNTISNHLRKLNFSAPASSGKHKWDKDGFAAWSNGEMVEIKKTEPVIEPVVEEKTPVIEPMVRIGDEWKPAVVKTDKEPEAIVDPTIVIPKPIIDPVPLMAIPTYGELNFDCNAEAALNTLRQLLGNSHVRLSVHWDIVAE